MAPTNLEKAKRERDSHKNTTVWLKSKLDLHSERPLTETMTDFYIKNLEELFIKVQENHTLILGLITDTTELDSQELERTSILDDVLHIQSSFMDIKATFHKEVKVNESYLPLTIPTMSSNSGPSEVKLPRLELPTFSGQLTEWMSFHDMFVAAVHNNTRLSKAQKLTYLRPLLKGDAARIVSNLPSSDGNYDIAWAQLLERFQNDRELFFAIMKKFVSQPSVPDDSGHALRKLVDVSKESIRSIEALGLPVEHWDAILVFLMTQKLDSQSRQFWELSLKDTSVPVLKDFLDFLETRARALTAGGTKNSNNQNQIPNQQQINRRRDTLLTNTENPPYKGKPCSICSGLHPHFKCVKFHEMSIQQRTDTVKSHKLCSNCLKVGHLSTACSSNFSCHKCQQKHHTLLHPENPSSSRALNHHVSSEDQQQVDFSQTLLATAIIKVTTKCGQSLTVRALLDNGSTSSIISESCARKLGLPRKHDRTEFRGLGASHLTTSRGSMSIVINSRFHDSDSSSTGFVVETLIVPRVTARIPQIPVSDQKWAHLQDLQYADPTYHTPGDIDILLGGDVFWSFILSGRIQGPSGAPTGVHSTFGWLIVGPVSSALSDKALIHHAIHAESDHDSKTLGDKLQQFWEIESIPDSRPLTSEESKCVQHFNSTHTRTPEGRFCVQLPLKVPSTDLGPSRDTAIRRLKSIERRLHKNPEHRNEYNKFMGEYLSLGHMALLTQEDVQFPKNPTYYIPHHLVIKDSSTTTKFRVVFDASCKTSTGRALNDCLMVGPTIQDNLMSLLLRFRKHPIALTADLAKMYRQVLVHPDHADLQRIVWRDDPTQPIQDFKLLTVTYGTASASYHATRVLHQLAEEEKVNYPSGSKALQDDTYVDDLMTGDLNVSNTIKLQHEVRKVSELGGFEFRKFSSNSPEVLASIPEELRETQLPLRIDLDESIKTLGLNWCPGRDHFSFKVTLPPPSPSYTKRIILSETAKVFDPLGWLSPIIIKAKILLQSLWKLDLGWDDRLPTVISQEWETIRSELKYIETISLPRCVTPEFSTHLALYGFSDASEKAYSAVVYIRVKTSKGQNQVSLIASKTRVAPTKTISLPRLELCGALLLGQLMSNVQTSMKLQFQEVRAWSDSTVVLAWLKAHPSRWVTFVANRVTQIQELIPHQQWSHVRGDENPADCASRGINPSELQSHPLWWQGPEWLRHDGFRSSVPNCTKEEASLIQSEQRKVPIISHVHFRLPSVPKWSDSLLFRYSSLSKIIRITAWWNRFTFNCKMKVSKGNPSPAPTLVGPLCVDELEKALLTYVKLVQADSFHTEVERLKKFKPLPSSSPILSLNPFLDPGGILRVGGRLRHSSLPMERKHPILLPRHHRLTDFIIMTEHVKALHAGPQLLLSIVQNKFWIIRAKDAIRFQVKKCQRCIRHGAQPLAPLMGDLPAARITPTRPFLTCGVDYAGPFILRAIPPKSKVTFKAYLAIFICFTTKAIHNEVVSSLSSDAFIAALKRFIARRGKCRDIYSDCGTNFIGANKELKDLQTLFQSKSHNNQIHNHLAQEGINWHFNPPSAPHMGGLWEAGVKSTKYHLHRIVGSTRLTFEELTTVMAQIESCLNSRPLTPISTDPNDLAALTPGHFLIGSPLTAIPEPDLTDTKTSRLSRWQMTQQLVQHFWNRWTKEFLSRLQERPKWLNQRTEIQLNDLVVVKEDNFPPHHWPLARVIALHPGEDKVTRVVTLKTANGEIKRPVVKIIVVPIDKQ